MPGKDPIQRTSGYRQEKLPTGYQLSRRGFLKIVAALGAGSIAAHILRLDRLERHSETRSLMGTIVNITLVSPSASLARQAAERCLAKMAALENLFSRFKFDSQLSVLNRSGFLPAADTRMIELINIARQISELTHGAYDISVKPLYDLYRSRAEQAKLPSQEEIARIQEKVGYQNILVDDKTVRFRTPGMSITLDSIAKGYIVDAGVQVLKSLGFSDVLLEAGGDLIASGKNEDLEDWTIGVLPPRLSQHSLQARFGVSNRAVATSGDYFQSFTGDFSQHHILNPHTGFSAPDLASATVIAPSAAWADGLSTALMALGKEQSIVLISSLKDVEAYLITKDLKAWSSPGFPQCG